MSVYKSLAVAISFFCLPNFLFAGCLDGNCWDGTGIYLYPSGARYSGQFKNGMIHGHGTLRFSTGDVYVGEWKNHYRDGDGKLSFKNGDEYAGAFRQNKFHGIGTMNFHNGDRYTGNWKSDAPNGFGKYFFKTGERYEGNFLSGKFDGQGSMFYTDGAKYVGAWKNNEKNGKGTIYWTDGEVQSGDWLNGELEDEKTEMTVHHSASEASLRDCNELYCASGLGSFIYSDGSKYIGEFKDGLPEGRGTVYYADGDKYVGGWGRHAPHGEGTMYFANGRVYGGVWSYGKTIRETKYQEKPVVTPKVETDNDVEVKIWAVVVGVGRYTAMPNLKYTDDDAYQMYAFLKSPEGGALTDEQVKILVDEDATRTNILQALQQTLLKADQNDVVLFYFSGHGLEGSFLPVDYDGYRNRLNHEEIKKILDKSQAKHKIVFADACHSGSLLALKAPVQNSLKRFYDAFESTNGGTALLMSSKSEEYSLEDGGLRSGIFSHYLIKGLKGDADKNRDGIVNVQELYEFVYSKVVQYTTGAQTPTLSGIFDKNMPVAIVR